MEAKIKEIPQEVFNRYYLPEEIIGYCMQCPNYGKFWSCPPHSFDTKSYFDKFKHFYVIGIKVYLNPLLDKKEQLEAYHQQKNALNRVLLEYEDQLNAAIILISGHCWHCKVCTRNKGNECCNPDKMRHSLESLGIKISSIIADHFNDELQWKKEGMPESLYVVQAILSNSKIDVVKVIGQLARSPS